MAKCATCGAELPGASRFCPSCGQPAASDELATHTIATAPTPSSPSPSRFAPGTLLAGRYRIVALLGKGGMGEVYRADDLTLEQPVALKFLPDALARNAGAVARFHNEVRIARQVSHPNVCRVYDVGEVDGRLFLSMEYVDGEDLGSLLRRIGRLPSDKALDIARALCAGLAAAHAKAVLHRDLKPGNVMLDGRGHVLLTDFGLAALAGEIQGGDVRSGTPAYMAPEQLAGEEVTVKSDIYSLGLVLYEVFTGKLPFESDTLAGLIDARRRSTPVTPSSLVRDLDPAVERAILHCLEPNPARRPVSALAVVAALPGGDPLAAALAAGETPSPELVAAAGEGAGLAPRVAIPLFAAVIVGIVVACWMGYRTSALRRMRLPYSPEVLSQKVRDLVDRLGYGAKRVDDAYGLEWNHAVIGWVRDHDKPSPRWNEVLSQRIPLLEFWYRAADSELMGVEFHNDLLTPDIVTFGDPAPVECGMVNVRLDAEGRLISFQAIPPQREDPLKEIPSADWSPLFAAAGLDPAQLQPDPPRWAWLAASDTRLAWTGKWPGTDRPLRVEAASWRGKPVAFSLMEPWTRLDRTPDPPSSSRVDLFFFLWGILAIGICAGAALLARRNLVQNRGDRHGAFRLAAWIFSVMMAIWICRTHFIPSVGMIGVFLLAICTAVFYGIVFWTLYVAVEPFVRRHWPQTIISWTSLLTGRLRDPVVGRDVLIGLAFGVAWSIIILLAGRWEHRFNLEPGFGSTDALLGIRSMLGWLLVWVPYGVRASLVFFFLLFLLRVVLRKQWAAAVAFVVFLSALNTLRSDTLVIAGTVSALIFGIAALVVLRWGLLALAVTCVVEPIPRAIPVTLNTSAWYFGGAMFQFAVLVVLAAYAFRVSIAGRRLWKQDWFG